MATELRSAVRNEVIRLRKNIEQKKETLASLQAELDKLQKVNEMLADGPVRPVRKPVSRQPRQRKKAQRGVDWDAVLLQLPDSFSVQQFANTREAKGKARAYLHQILGAWAKEGKVTRVGRGSYQKA